MSTAARRAPRERLDDITEQTATVVEELSRVGLLAAFSDAGVITPVALDLTPIFQGKDFDTLEAFELFESFGRFLGRVHRSAKWWLADWLNFGDGAFGHRFEQALAATGLNEEYLRNIMWVGRNVLPSKRRDGVAFGLHTEVAALTPDEQTRWLDWATATDPPKTTRELRLAIKAERNGGVTDGHDDADERRPLAAARILEAATLVARRAVKRGDSYVVPAEAFVQLLAAVGEGD